MSRFGRFIFVAFFVAIGCSAEITSPPNQLTECVSLDGTDSFTYYIRNIETAEVDLFGNVSVTFVDTDGFERTVTSQSAVNYKCKTLKTGED